MNAKLQDFLAARLPFPGLAAWTARLPDRTLASQSYADWLPVAHAEQVLGRLLLASDSLQYHQLRPRRLCWKFEHLCLRIGFGQDGACLMLIEQNQPEFANGAGDSVLEDFARSPVA
jgi:hypothetical protein